MTKVQALQVDPLSGIATLIERFTELQRQCNEYSQRRVNLQEEAKAVNARRPALDARKRDLLQVQQQQLQVGDEDGLSTTMTELRAVESEHATNRSRLAEIDIERQHLADEARSTLEPDFQELSAESKQIEDRIAAMLRDLVHVRRTTLNRLAAATRN